MAEPEFFYRHPDELVSLLKQRNRASFGGAGTRLREELSNAGLLQSGAYPSSLTQLSIAQGQSEVNTEAGFLTDVYKMERGAELEFNLQKWIEEQRRKQGLLQSLITGLGALGGGIGSYLGSIASSRGVKQATGRLAEEVVV